MNDKELTAVKQALQEYVNADNSPLEVNPRKRAAIAALEQQPAAWVGLTDEERMAIYNEPLTISRCMDMVEAKLREKNENK